MELNRGQMFTTVLITRCLCPLDFNMINWLTDWDLKLKCNEVGRASDIFKKNYLFGYQFPALCNSSITKYVNLSL